MKVRPPRYLCGPRRTPARGSLKILLIDENEAELRLFQEAFGALDIQLQLDAQADGAETLALLKVKESETRIPSLILLGVDGKGFEILHAVRAHPAWRTVPVVMLGTTGEPREVKRAYEMGANSYVCKPVDDFADFVGDIDRFWLRRAVLPARPAQRRSK